MVAVVACDGGGGQWCSLVFLVVVVVVVVVEVMLVELIVLVVVVVVFVVRCCVGGGLAREEEAGGKKWTEMEAQGKRKYGINMRCSFEVANDKSLPGDWHTQEEDAHFRVPIDSHLHYRLEPIFR